MWMYQLSDDVSRFTGDRSTTPGTEILLTIITCGIYGLYWIYKYSKKMWEISINVGVPYPSDNSIINLVVAIFGLSLVSMGIMQISSTPSGIRPSITPTRAAPTPTWATPIILTTTPADLMAPINNNHHRSESARMRALFFILRWRNRAECGMIGTHM